MISVKNIFKKENLIAAGGLGAGSLAAEIVAAKVTKAFTGDDLVVKNEKIIPYIPVFTGLLLATSTGFIKNVGYGMLAQGVAKVGKSLIPAETQIELGIGQDVMMGNVMMGDSRPPLAGYSSDSYDYTSAAAGEMSF
jgi:hypothetical protein|tara:strand:+ start:1098 stop:1508 length:411 start_codon:yes stop_codon:yes gene_type:complete